VADGGLQGGQDQGNDQARSPAARLGEDSVDLVAAPRHECVERLAGQVALVGEPDAALGELEAAAYREVVEETGLTG
jgi:hypothetical protein